MSHMFTRRIPMKYAVIVLLTLATASVEAGPQGSERRARKLDGAAADAREQALRRAQVWMSPSFRWQCRHADNPGGANASPLMPWCPAASSRPESAAARRNSTASSRAARK